MSNQGRDQEMRDMVREVLRELVPGVAPQPAPARGPEQASAHGRADGVGQASGNGHGRADGSGRAPANGSGRANGGGRAPANASGRAAANGSGRAPADGGGRARANGQPSGGGANVVPRVPAPPVAAVIRPSTWDRPPAPGEVIGHSQPAPAAESTSRAARSPLGAGAGSRSRPGGPAPAGEPTLRAERLQAAFRDSDFRPATAARRQAATRAGAPPAASTAASVPASAGDDVRVEVVTLDSDEDLEQFVRGLMTRLDNPRERLAIRTGRLRFSLRRSAASPSVSSGGAAAPATRVEKGAVTERMIRTAAAEGARLVLAPGAVLTPLAREQAKARGVEIERERRC